MTLAELLAALPATGLDGLALPPHLLGAFRRKSITFCTGLTDETTAVYWFQSRSFTIDLRLSDGAATPVTARQGWVGDTLWDGEQMSWHIARSYQPHDQWPEPARLAFIGNSVIEFAPSGAYLEDWRQQSARGPLLGLRLESLLDGGQELPMAGGLIVAGEHVAYAQSRMPALDDALRGAGSLEQALADGISEREIESYEVSVAMGGAAVTHSTQPERLGRAIVDGDFEIEPDGAIMMTGTRGRLRFSLDLFQPDFAFDRQTEATPEALEWLERERGHLALHARVST